MEKNTQSNISVKKSFKALKWTEVNIADITKNPPRQPEFLIEPWLPADTLTLFSGHGGTGKSLLSLLIAIHLSLGLKLFEKEVKKCPVLFYSAEDSREIIRHRIGNICNHLGVNPSQVAENLIVLDATDLPCLYEIGSNDKGKSTDQYLKLNQYLERLKVKPKLLIIDNASNTFDGNENNRKHTREFLYSLIQSCKHHLMAVLLLAHVDKPTAKGEYLAQGYSGSTAWHNSARSRWFLQYEKDDLILFHQKSNYAKLDDPITLTNHSGLILIDKQSSIAINSRNIKVLLTLFDKYYQRGDYISPLVNSRSNPFATFRDDCSLPKEIRTRKAMRQYMEFLEANSLLTRETYSNQHYKDRIRYKVTERGLQLMAQNATSETAASGIDLVNA